MKHTVCATYLYHFQVSDFNVDVVVDLLLVRKEHQEEGRPG